MNIIAVDDETIALAELDRAIRQAVPGAKVKAFALPDQALTYAKKNPVDVAFLDVEMAGMSGIELAHKLKDARAQTNIIFVTGYAQYMPSAFSMHASGYVLKPVLPSHIQAEMEALRHPIGPASSGKVQIQCFGNFEVYKDGTPLSFARSKSKELLAYLVDRRGAGVTAAEIGSALWGDKEYNRSMQKQVQTAISQLMKTLKEAGVESIVRKSWNSLSIDPEQIECDYYQFLNGSVSAINAYTGEYMQNYSWAEFTTGFLTQVRMK